MAPSPHPPAVSPVTVIRAVAIFDIALGLAMALFGNAVVPMDDMVPGIPLWWVVGGALAAAGAGTLVLAAQLDRRRRSADAAARGGPVERH